MRDYVAGDPRTNRERVLAGDLYVADDPENGRRARRAVQLADAYHRAIKPPLFVDYGEHISVGPRTFVNDNPVTLDVAPIRIGGGVIVLPGMTIGDNTVVGAGSVVTRDLPADALALGNPARVVRPLP